MASITYDSFFDDQAKGNITTADTFKMMLVTSSYVPNKGTHAKRSDITNEVSGTGYSAGGQVVTLTEALDTSGHKVTWTPSTENWTSSTLSAAGAVIYKSRGGAASADNLVAYIDFGGTIVDTNGTFTVTNSAPLTEQN